MPYVGTAIATAAPRAVLAPVAVGAVRAERRASANMAAAGKVVVKVPEAEMAVVDVETMAVVWGTGRMAEEMDGDYHVRNIM